MAQLGIVTHEDRYRLLLEISRIVNAPVELSDVTDAIAKALQPLAAVDTLVLVTVENQRMVTRSLHISGFERQEGETFQDVAARALNLTPEEMGELPIIKPLAGSNVEYAARLGRPYVVNNLTESTVRFEMDRKLIRFGVKAYVVCAVRARDRLIGAVMFNRRELAFFSDDEVELLNDISGIVGPALSNSLAYEQIRTLRDQLQEENVFLRQRIAEVSEPDEMVGTSWAMRGVQEAIDKVAGTDSTVLICGETGTGKELVARAIHRRSARVKKDLVKINCAALPQGLIASELFGHERGAFTGATQRRIGRFEMAAGSSIFLDEIGEVPMDVQVSLLRILQEREFERLGGSQTIRADVRLIAATNRDLQQAMAAGTFRSDLFYRLNVFPINVPPLRERAEDIPVLIESFVRRFSEKMGRRIRSVDPGTMELLLSYCWPGNIRELQNVVERAVILSEDGILRVEPAALAKPTACMELASPVSHVVVTVSNGHGAEHSNGHGSALRHQERDLIETALAQCRGRISGPNGAALRLRMPASTLESKIRALNIDKHRFRSQPLTLAKGSAA